MDPKEKGRLVLLCTIYISRFGEENAPGSLLKAPATISGIHHRHNTIARKISGYRTHLQRFLGFSSCPKEKNITAGLERASLDLGKD